MSRRSKTEAPAPFAVEGTSEEDGGGDATIDVGSPLFFPSSLQQSATVTTPETSKTDVDGEEEDGADAVDAEGGVGDDAVESGGGNASVTAGGTGANASHLIEGDFFPEAPVSVLEEIENGVEEEEEEDEEEDEGEKEEGEETSKKRAKVESEPSVDKERAGSQATAPTPPKPARPTTRKRVRWAGNLIKHVTVFYMPSQSPQASAAGAPGVGASSAVGVDPASPTFIPPPVAPAPPSIFSDRVNADGTKYKCCKAQRPSQRFTDWKRQMQQLPQAAAAASSAQSPFSMQPRDGDEGLQGRRTLFASLFRPPGAAHGAPCALPMGPRRSEPHGRTRPALAAPPAARCPQLPSTDPAALFDEPQPLPL